MVGPEFKCKAFYNEHPLNFLKSTAKDVHYRQTYISNKM